MGLPVCWDQAKSLATVRICGVAEIINSEFATPVGWGSGHLQTVRSRVVRRNYDLAAMGVQRSGLVPMQDGSGDRVAVHLHEVDRHESRGLVLLVHGLGGSAESDYVRATAMSMLQAGFNVARVDLRGAGWSWYTSAGLYHAGRTGDLRDVIRQLALMPEAQVAGRPRIFLMGFSLGGNTTIKLLGEPMADLPVAAAVAVSAPLDLNAGAVHLSSMAFGLYEKYLLTGLRRQVLRPGPEGESRVTRQERELVQRARTIADFDDAITAPRNGWRDANEYYRVNSSGQFLADVAAPLLVVHSVDDPMVPSGPYREIDWNALERNASVQRIITPVGGHVGFHERGQRLPWFTQVAAEFLLENAGRPNSVGS
jgi:predicted alpha/beta-fold hydrolase